MHLGRIPEIAREMWAKTPVDGYADPFWSTPYLVIIIPPVDPEGSNWRRDSFDLGRAQKHF